MIPLQKKTLEIGSYLLEVFFQETERTYADLSLYQGGNEAVRYFHHLLPKAEKESVAFIESLGIDLNKISVARPLTAPDENGEILYLCTARFCGKVLRGGDTIPRQSEEIAGISVVFVSEKNDFTPNIVFTAEDAVEIRFVIPLPFDPTFFE